MRDDDSKGGVYLLRCGRFMAATAVYLFAILIFGVGCAKTKVEEVAVATVVETAVSAPTDAPTIPPTIPVAAIPTLINASAAPTALRIETAVSTPLPPEPTLQPPSFESVRDEMMAQTAVSQQSEFVWLNPANTALWQYPENLFNHPIALDVYQETAYLLDGGRVLALDLAVPALPQLLLSAGDEIAGVRVLEILDLTVAADGLLVLDRAGDVYLYTWATQQWQIDRYDRPISDSSGHYYVAVAEGDNGRYLLEANYRYVRRYDNLNRDQLWNLAEQFMVDVAVQDNSVYVLSQAAQTRQGQIALYQDTRLITTFAPAVELIRPRQLMVTETAVYVLDMAGQRLLTLDKSDGTVQQITQMPPDVNTFWVNEAGDGWIMAGEGRIYFNGRLPPSTYIQPDAAPSNLLSAYYPTSFERVENLIPPIGGTNLTQRDLQMPGAPRHYRYGVHEGVDFYWGRGTAVQAIADGIVVRVTGEGKRPSATDFTQARTQSQQLGYTSPEALDLYRGIQVWIQHNDGTTSRYAHLSKIALPIIEGASVTQGQLLGEVGNSGSPSSLDSETADAHLHFELWQESHYLGQYLRPIETRDILGSLFGNIE